MVFGLDRLKISQTLPALLVGSALVVGCGVGAAAYFVASETVTEQAETKLSAIADASNREIANFFDSVKRDVVSTTSSTTTVDAVKQFAGTWADWAEVADAGAQLQEAYIAGNPNPVDERHLLNVAKSADISNTNSLYYNMHHERFHPGYRAQLEQQGYYDILLFDPNGNLVYSLAKGADFAGNFAEGGTWAETGLGKVFRTAATLERGSVAFSDFAAYAPSDGVAASFMGTPVLNDAGGCWVCSPSACQSTASAAICSTELVWVKRGWPTSSAQTVCSEAIWHSQALQWDTALRRIHIIAEWVPVNNDDTGGIVRGKTRWQGLSAADISPEQVLTVPMTSKNKKATRHDLTCCPLVSEILKVAPLPGVGPLIISEKTGLPYRENYYATDWREIAKLPAFRRTSGPWMLGRGNLRGRGGDGRPRCGPEACWSLDAEDDTHLCPQRRPRQ